MGSFPTVGVTVRQKLLLGFSEEFEVPDDGLAMMVQQLRGQFARLRKLGSQRLRGLLHIPALVVPLISV